MVEAKRCFAERPNVKDELLEEVLGSNLLCITDEELFSFLRKWNDAAGLITKWVSGWCFGVFCFARKSLTSKNTCVCVCVLMMFFLLSARFRWPMYQTKCESPSSIQKRRIWQVMMCRPNGGSAANTRRISLWVWKASCRWNNLVVQYAGIHRNKMPSTVSTVIASACLNLVWLKYHDCMIIQPLFIYVPNNLMYCTFTNINP